FAPDENGLVAVKRAAAPSEESRHGFEPHQPRMAAIEFPKESAADNSWVGERSLDCFQMRCLEERVAMLEKNDVAAAGGGAEIHLFAAIRRGAGNESRAGAERDLLRDGVARRVHHDRFGDTFLRGQRGQKRFQILRVAPRWDHHADSKTRVRSVATQVHCGFFSKLFRARSSARRSEAVRLLI